MNVNRNKQVYYFPYLVTNLNRCFPLLLCSLGNLFTMFVCSRDKVAVDTIAASFVIQASKSSNRIGRCGFICVTHMCWSIGIVDGCGDVESLCLRLCIVDIVTITSSCSGRRELVHGGVTNRSSVVAIRDTGWIAESPAIVNIDGFGCGARRGGFVHDDVLFFVTVVTVLRTCLHVELLMADGQTAKDRVELR